MSLNSEIVGEKYKIVKILGEGSFGKTYLAENLHNTQNKYAIKHLSFPKNDPSFSKAVALFIREADILKSLNKHPNIPEFVDFLNSNQEFYIVQEFIEGKLLSEEFSVIQSEEYIVKFLKEALLIINFIHSHSIIHRDIKPANLMRRHNGELVFIDFGSVKQVVTQTILQKPTTRIYTPGYAPKEQINGNPQFNSDIYALGVTVIQALTGLEPSLMPTNNNGDFIWKDKVKVSLQLVAILAKMIESDYIKRYQSVAEIIKDLEKTNLEKEQNFIVKINYVELSQPKSLSKIIEALLWIVLVVSSIILILLTSGVLPDREKQEKEKDHNVSIKFNRWSLAQSALHFPIKPYTKAIAPLIQNQGTINPGS